ncbi:TAP-like protein-domain-containing protein [Xylariaceae sp. FL0804]|nr:TAP-like protein-domain-containing protein [Xylariaceae sp. FL0804]
MAFTDVKDYRTQNQPLDDAFYADQRAQQRRRRLTRHLILLALVPACIVFALGLVPQKVLVWGRTWSRLSELACGPASEKSSSKWSDITPSRDLEWHKCYDGEFECARLDVPLDWLDPSEDERVVLAVLRSAATARDDYRGPVFLNPGGPGGSGVDYLRSRADEFHTVIGENYDLISFDPRGVGASVPRVDCWQSPQNRHDWSLTKIDVVDAHPGLVFDAYASSDAFSRECGRQMPDLLPYLSTASHARDMLEISEKAGYEMLRYWGVSYGTILGGTFAAMFPDRVERLVSDGNVDYDDWYSLAQINFIEDADKIMEAFFDFCHRAGPTRCAFHAHSPYAIQTRFFSLVQRLKTRPVLVPAGAAGDGQPHMPELVTYSAFQLAIRSALYKPIHAFPGLARAMAALEAGDGRPFYRMQRDSSNKPTRDYCAANPTPPGVPLDDGATTWDAFPAIMCADGERFADTPEEFVAYAETLQRLSRYAGASNTHFRLSCAGRGIRPRWRAAPPWRDDVAGATTTTTANPILFIGNVADNVTPLLSARNNSAVFPGSRVLVQRSYGHSSLAAPSTCTARVIRAYFQNGTLPDEGAECDQDYELFEDPPDTSAAGEEGRLMEAVRKLSQETRLGFGHEI